MTLERALRLMAGVVVIASVLLGMFVHPRFLFITLFAGANLVQSAFTDWCPIMPVLRRACATGTSTPGAGVRRS